MSSNSRMYQSDTNNNNEINNIYSGNMIDNNNFNGGNVNSNDGNITNNTQKNLFNILNSQTPSVQQLNTQQNQILNTSITDEDVAFLKAANEVIKLHESRVDPTIRDILNRLQYSNSPHGGMPFSIQYLRSIGATKNSVSNSSETGFIGVAEEEKEEEGEEGEEDEEEEGEENYEEDYEVAEEEEKETKNHSFGDRMSILSTSENLISNNNDNGMHTTNYNHIDTSKQQPDSQSFFIPPFTENPLRHQPSNLDFPQFSLDIFKTDNNLNSNIVQNNNINNIHKSDNKNDNNEKILNYPVIFNSTINNNINETTNTLFKNQIISDGGILNEDDTINNENNNFNDNNGTPRNYRCSNCGISFKRSSDLKRHERIHLKVPPNICPLCRKGFARKDALKRHVDTLTCKRNRQRLLKQMEEES